MSQIRRRQFLISAGALLTSALAARAQHSARGGVYRIGYVTAQSRSSDPSFDAFRQGLSELGYVEGKNILVEARFAEGELARLPALVAELIALKVDVLLAGSPVSVVAAKNATTTVPIVFAGVGDPVASGIVASLARPGGNVTGAAVGAGGAGFGATWLGLLKEAVPDATRFAVLANRSNRTNSPHLQGVEAAARTAKVEIDILDAGNAAELDRAFAVIGASGAQGMIVTSDPFLFNSRTALVQFAERRRLPAIYFFKPFAVAGGLMSYGASLEDSYRRAATYVDKILKGAKPADLPVEQPTQFELVVNLKTAKTLGIRIPPSILIRADSVIER